MHPLGGPPKMQFLGHRYEVSHVPKLHIHINNKQ